MLLPFWCYGFSIKELYYCRQSLVHCNLVYTWNLVILESLSPFTSSCKKFILLVSCSWDFSLCFSHKAMPIAQGFSFPIITNNSILFRREVWWQLVGRNKKIMLLNIRLTSATSIAISNWFWVKFWNHRLQANDIWFSIFNSVFLECHPWKFYLLCMMEESFELSVYSRIIHVIF